VKGSRAKQLKAWQIANIVSQEYLSCIGEVPVEDIHHMSKQDIGRWILKHNERSLNEYFPDNSSCVKLSKIDEIALILSLRYVLDSRTQNDVLAFFISPEVYSFSLLLTFHLLIHQGAERLLSEEMQLGTRFKPDSGVLLISDNVELSSRLVRTCYGQSSLNEIFRTLKLKQDGGYEPLSKLQPQDTTYPWFAFFRAYRHQMPTNLQLTPELLVVDAIPLKHRDRIGELIDWGKACGIPKIITVCTLGDSDNYKLLKNRGSLIYPIDRVALGLYNENPMKSNDIQPITGCWTHLYTYASPQRISYFNFCELTGVEQIEEKIQEAFQLISAAEAKCKGLPIAIGRLKAILLDLLTMLVPIYWYERERQDSGQATLQDLISMSRKAVPLTPQEKIVFEYILPILCNVIQEIYDILNSTSITPKGQGLKSVINRIIKNNASEKTILLVNDNTTAKVLIPWLSSSIGTELGLENEIQVYTFKEFFRERITYLELKQKKQQTNLVFCGWIPRKYLGILFCDIAQNIDIIYFPMEQTIIQKQIMGLFGQQIYRDQQSMRLLTFKRLFGRTGNLSSNYTDIAYKPQARKVTFPVSVLKKKTDPVERETSNVFGADALAKLLEVSYEKNLEKHDVDNSMEIDELDDLEINGAIMLANTGFNSRNDVRAIRLELENNKEMYLSPFEDYKVFVRKSQKLDDRPASAIYKGDYIVRLKGGERREIFDEILEISGQTPMMTYIRYRIQQWQGLVRRFYDDCSSPEMASYEVYLSMLQKIKSAGGTITTISSLANWMRGKSNCVRDYENVRAVAIALNDAGNIEQYKRIYQAMRSLWNIHIEIGLKLSHSLRRQILKVVEGADRQNDYIEVVNGVKIPIQEVLEAIEVFEVTATDEQKYIVPNYLLGRILLTDDRKKIFGEFSKEA
jgi:hypothetical protein